MNKNIKLKRLVEETFAYKCKGNFEFIYASSSKELGEKIQEILKREGGINCYEFITNSGCRIGGSLPNASAALKNLSNCIENLKIGYMEVISPFHSYDHIKSLIFSISDHTKECIKMISNVGVSRNIELSSYNDFSSLQKAFINIITDEENSELSFEYTIFRENENCFGTIESTGKEKIKSIIIASENIKKYSEYILAVSIRMNSYNNKTKKIKHFVLFMV